MASFLKTLLFATVVVAIAAGCKLSPKGGLDGLPCEPNEPRCLPGYVCDQGSNTCARSASCTDADQDGYCEGPSDCDDTVATCNVDCTDADGDGTAACAGDCDDSTLTGSNCVTGCTIYYLDNDSDMLGDSMAELSSCAGGAPSGYVSDNTDCDDTKFNCRTDCTDVDGDDYCVDFDCDDSAETGVTCNSSCPTFYEDLDIDGLGNPTVSVTTCVAPTGFVDNSNDCYDLDMNCTDDCAVDADGDGFPECADCNDILPDCTTDCTTDGDGDGVVDCFEVACGTVPTDITDACLVADGTAGKTLTDILTIAEGTAVEDTVLLAYSFDATASITINVDGDGNCIELVAYGSITMVGNNDILIVETNDCTLTGITTDKGSSAIVINGNRNIVRECRISGAGKEAVELNGDFNIVRDCDIGFWTDRSAVRIDGDDNQVIHNYIHDGDALGSQDDDAGIYLSSGGRQDNVIADNLIARINGGPGIHLRDNSIRTIIDHNTIVGGNEAGIEFSSNQHTNVCMRNNLIVGNLVAIELRNNSPTWQGAPCTDPLLAGPMYGNGRFGNNTICNQCGACATCAPSMGTFWEFNTNPQLDPTTYCLGAETHIDAVQDLMDYDLSGTGVVPSFTDGGTVMGDGAPDVGAQEDGSGQCL